MFTGLVSDIGTIERIEGEHDDTADLRLWIGCGYDLAAIPVGASIACSGACITLVDKSGDKFAVDVSRESVSRTASGMWRTGSRLNLERSLKVGDELGGHIVTGHVDGVARIVEISNEGASRRFVLGVERALGRMIAPKGSIALDGVSLTVNGVEDVEGEQTRFDVNIIPHTLGVTTIGDWVEGGEVNVEIDILARYLDRMVTK